VRQKVALGSALLAAAAGVFLLLLAVDVHRWQSRMAADDVAFRTEPRRNDLWSPPQLFPGVARGLLGVRDDVESREALRIFKLGQTRKLFYLAGPQLIAYRSAAQALLTRNIDHDTNPTRRAQAHNLLGVLELIAVGGGDPQTRQRYLPRAAENFRNAILLDEQNEDAKFNLELTLRLLEKQRQTGGAQSGLGGTTARGDEIGSGY
jgi:hypothetical protein